MSPMSALLRSTSILATLALAAACGSDSPAAPGDNGEDPPPEERAEWPAGFLVGGDVSALARIEQGGATFQNDGVTMDAIAALVADGANVFRLRLFVDPNGEEVQVNDLPYTMALAERVVAEGATLILDFHYSDTWADPGRQTTPAAWQSLEFDALEDTVEAYTADVIAQMKDAGALPDIVQIGNEIDSGLLWPLGRIGGTGYDQPENFERFGRLLKAAIRGVESALDAGDDVRIMLQYSQGASMGGTRWFFDRVAEQGVDYDVIGLSFYPWWHGTLSNLTINLHDAAARNAKDVMVVETNYPWRTGWTPSGARADWQDWPLTPAGQADFLRDVIDAVAATPNGRGLGVVWWYPEAVLVSDLFVWGGGALALFDASGDILPAAGEFTEP